MGYFIKGLEIAKETVTPAKVSLAGNPNYIEFSSNATGENRLVEMTLEVIGNGFDEKLDNFTKFTIVEKNSGEQHVFEATTDISSIGGGTYYISPSWSFNKIAEALKNVLQANSFIGNNFNILFPPITDDEGNITYGRIIKLISKGSGSDYTFNFIPGYENPTTQYLKVSGPSVTVSNDSIGGGYNPVEIQLELYKDTGIFLGEDDRPVGSNMGTLAMTLTKAYSYTPIWFNLNILETNNIPVDFLNATDWVNTGTINNFRFAAKRLISGKDYYDNSLFYYSPVLYTVAGNRRTLEENDLSDYVFNTQERLKSPEEIKKVKPLTNQPDFFHIKGQTQYFSFILSDAEHSINVSKEYQLGIVFRIYSQSGRFIADKYDHFKARKNFNEVNTVRLNLDKAIEGYENAGKVEIYLAYRYGSEVPVDVSKPLKFNILPECLHKVKDFAFLNSLGGWSSFNFLGTEQSEFKAEANTIFKTQTPHYSVSSGIESVYNKNVSEQFTVQTMPVTMGVCNWLKELSASKAVYELSTKRYVIVDEMNIKPNSKDELFRVDMKYRYSDAYN